MNRREFFKSAIALAGFQMLAMDTRSPNMIYRSLGKTGEKVSAIGLGGYHIGIPSDENESIRIIRTAIDRGITFLDNCWDYHDGESERRMGKALKDGYRAKIFLMTKIDGRNRKAAEQQINESLQRLQVDHIDLLQIHEVIRMEDADRVFAADGCIHALMEARKAGKIRFIGFTGHKDPSIHLNMLSVASAHNFQFDTVQMPLNVMDSHFRSFADRVLPELIKNNIGAIGMKPMGDPFILQSKTVSAIECLHYALNLGASTVITGIDRMEILDQAFEAVRRFHPLSKAEVDSLLSRTAKAAANGDYEKYKTSDHFDGTEHNPQWLG